MNLVRTDFRANIQILIQFFSRQEHRWLEEGVGGEWSQTVSRGTLQEVSV